MLNQDLAKEHCRSEVTLCPCFEEGQQFLTSGLEKPANFCDWAWNDIYKFVTVLLAGGNFSQGIFEGWMKDDREMIACCTDGIRPVVFKIEKVVDSLI
jgi:TIGR04076 family protein